MTGLVSREEPGRFLTVVSPARISFVPVEISVVEHLLLEAVDTVVVRAIVLLKSTEVVLSWVAISEEEEEGGRRMDDTDCAGDVR